MLFKLILLISCLMISFEKSHAMQEESENKNTSIKRFTQKDIMFYKESISIKNAKGIKITLFTLSIVNIYEEHSIYGDFFPVELRDNSYKYYIAEIYVSRTNTHEPGLINPPDPYEEYFKRDFYFASDEDRNINLHLLIPSGFKIESIEICN